MLFRIAAPSHTLRGFMGIELDHSSVVSKIKIVTCVRPWLKAHILRPNDLSFDPDAFFKLTRSCSEGERHMVLWLLNVWNPSYAKNKKWHFDLFDALGGLDSENRSAIVVWLNNPQWP